MRATCPANLIFLDLITVILYGQEYKFRSSTFGPCNFPRPLNFMFLGRNVIIGTMLTKPPIYVLSLQ
jgi:hypothetical protein